MRQPPPLRGLPLALLLSLVLWIFIIAVAAAIARAAPRPDPAPGAHHPAVILPLCPYLAGVPSSSWVTGTDAAGDVVCVGPNLPPARRHHRRHHVATT